MKSRSEEVVVYDNFTSGQKWHLAHHAADKRLRVVERDVKNLNKLMEAMAGCAVVFHLAANPDIAKAVIQPDIDFWEGTYLTQNVLEAMRLNQVKKIFYSSGSGVYGETGLKRIPEEYGPMLPISTYGRANWLEKH